MPLFHGQPVPLREHPAGITPDTPVFVVRFTKEVFLSYEEYLERLEFLRQKHFACSASGKRKLTYEQALASEVEMKNTMEEGFSQECYPLLLHLTHYSTLNLNGLAKEVFNQLKPLCKEKNIRVPLKKVIKYVIKSVATKEKWSGAPWLVSEEHLEKHKISKAMPSDVALALSQRNKPRNRAASSSSNSSLADHMPTASLKYPCEDMLLLVHGKATETETADFDALFHSVSRVGCRNPPNETFKHDSVSRLTHLYAYDTETRADYLLANDSFSEIWRLWSFCDVFSIPLRLQRFPVTHLIDALMHPQRNLLLEEVHRVLLDMIREDVMEKWNPGHEAMTRRSRRRHAPRKMVVDESTDSEDSGSATDTESEFEGSNISQVPSVATTVLSHHPVFDDGPIVTFRFDILRDYLVFEWESEVAEEESETISEEMGTLDMKESEMNGARPKKSTMRKERESARSILGEDGMATIRSAKSYFAIPLQYKLSVLRLLMKNAFATQKMARLVSFQLDEYKQALKQVAEREAQLGAWLKEERIRLKEMRTAISVKREATKKQWEIVKSLGGGGRDSDDKENVDASAGHSRTSRQVTLQRTKANDAYEALRDKCIAMDEEYKEVRDKVSEEETKRRREMEAQRFETLRNCRLRMAPLGEDRFHRMYFWNECTNGRLFIYSPLSLFPTDMARMPCREHPLLRNVRLTLGSSAHSAPVSARCMNPWEVANGEVRSDLREMFHPCWACINTTSHFRELLRVLDHRGEREANLLTVLRGLEERIAESMRREGRDDYEPVDDDSDDAPLRRSKRSAVLGTGGNPARRFLQYKNRFLIR